MKTAKPILSALVLSVFIFSFAFRPVADTYEVDAANSSIKWTGYHLAKSYEHWGNINVQSGSITMEGDNITGGEFVIDMNSMTCGDIADEGKSAKLVGHLKSDDFFNTEKFPEAKLVIKNATKSGDTYNVTADITIRGISNEITFDATKSGSGDDITFDASISVDRTVHKVSYGWTIENAVLSNEFTLDVKLAARK